MRSEKCGGEHPYTKVLSALPVVFVPHHRALPLGSEDETHSLNRLLVSASH